MKNKKHMCVVFYIIECVYWYSRVTWLCLLTRVREQSIFPRLFILCIHFCCIFWEWDEWHSLRSFGSLSIPSLRSLLMWLPFIFDLSGSSLILVFCASSSSLFSLLIHHFHFTSHSFLIATHFLVWYSLCIIITHFIIVSVPLIDTMFAVGILSSMAHEIFYTCCISYMRAWVSNHWVFRPGFLSFLSPYHPSLRYVLCLKTILRPWDQISYSTTSSWTGVWDLVDI